MSKKVCLVTRMNNERKSNIEFDSAHRKIKIIINIWIIIIWFDRLAGIITGAYAKDQIVPAIIGGGVLTFIAILGKRGWFIFAVVCMQINMSVFVFQLVTACFLYKENIKNETVIFYAVAAMVLIVCSLIVFLDRGIEDYRTVLSSLKRELKN